MQGRLKIPRFASLALTISLVGTITAHAKPRNMRRDVTASRGSCLIPAISLKVHADDLLRDYKITTVDGGVEKITRVEIPPEPVAPAPANGVAATNELDKTETTTPDKKSEDKKPEAKKPDAEKPAPKYKTIIEYIKSDPPRSLEQERMALAKGLAQITALNGGRFKPFKKTRIEFVDRTGHSEELGRRPGDDSYRITMNRCDPDGKNCSANNVAHLVHELGHQLGNSYYRDEETYYQAYKRLVRGDCYPTAYSDDRFNEQFAEVFSAYVTHPELLKTGGPVCERAYAFFAADVFIHNGFLASCAKVEKEKLLQHWIASTKQIEEEIAAEAAAEKKKKKSKIKAAEKPKTIVRFKVVEAKPKPVSDIPLPIRKPKQVAAVTGKDQVADSSTDSNRKKKVESKAPAAKTKKTTTPKKRKR